jgi:cysteine desulfurase/selenocysteine lyase
MWKLGDIMIMNSQEEMGNSFLKSDEILSGYHSFIGSNHLDIMNKLANEIYKENIIPSLNAGPGTGEKGMPGKQSIGAYAGDFAYYFLNEYKEVPASKQLNGSYKSFDIDIPSIRKDFPILQRRVNGRPLVWLDNSATTQKPMQVINAISRYYGEYNSNIHRGAHTLAKLSTNAYESAREKVRSFIGASSAEEIVFVRGATEAINLVAESFGGMNIQNGDEILISTMEHHSNIVPWQKLQRTKGAVLKVIPINDRGEIIMEEYEKLLTPRTRIVAVTHVSNTLGTINPVAAMIEMAHKQGAYVLVDGAQSVPHLPVDVKELDADFYVFSGHKIYGPTGIGVLYGKKRLLEEMPPWQRGGGMIKNVSFNDTTYNNLPYKFEAGTGNIADAIGLGKAIEYVQKIGMENIEYHEKSLTVYAMEKLYEIPGIRIIGTSSDKTSVISFVLKDVSPENAAYYLNQEGIAVRAGHHCAQPALNRYGLTSTIRSSFALYNTFEEVDLLAKALHQIAR